MKTLCILLIAALSVVAGDQSVTLQWDRNPETNVVAYLVYIGNAPRDYASVTNVGNITTAAVRNLDAGTNWYFAVVAMTDRGLISEYSNEVSVTIPPKPKPTVIRDAQWHPPQIPLIIRLEFPPLIITTAPPATATPPL